MLAGRRYVRMKQLASVNYRALPTNLFARNVSVLVGGTISGQAIVALVAPLLTRLYPPQDFGLLAVFAALLSLATVVASLRYDQAIPLPDDDKDAAALLSLSFCAIVLTAALIAAPILLYRNEIAHLLNTPRLENYLWLLPLGILSAGAYNVLTLWAVRMKEFSPIAKAKVSQSAIGVSIQLSGASLGPVALLLGHIAGHASGFFSLGLRVLGKRRAVMRGVRLSDIVHVAKQYKKFPVIAAWGALLNTVGVQLPQVLLSVSFGPAVAGIYALANRVLSIPLQVLGQAIANVFFSSAAQANRDGTLRPMVANVHGYLAHIGMPPIVALSIAGPEIFGRVFGPEWRQAGIFSQWLAPWLYLVFTTSPLTGLFYVLGRQATGMAFECMLLIIRVAAICAGAWIGDAVTAVALFGLGSAACWLCNLIWILRVSGNTWSFFSRSTLSAFGWALGLVSPIILSSLWNVTIEHWSLGATFLLTAARYVYLLKSASL
jgi:O-antigen/teichoic acid export membrane protein